MRVLALIGDPPDPPITAVRVRNKFLWPAVQRLGVELKVLGTDYRPDRARPATFPGIDAEFFGFQRDPLPSRAWKVLTRSYHQFPTSGDLSRRVDEVAASWRPDIIHAEELRMAKYLPGMRGRGTEARQSVTIHNVERDLYERIATPAVPVGRGPVKRLHLRSLRAYEARLAARTDRRFAFSDVDRQRYATLFPGVAWDASRNGADALGITPAPQPAGTSVLLLASWAYAPNREGLIWFLDGVLPHLTPGAAITVAGSGADDEIRRRLADRRIPFIDTPMDLKPLYDEHAIAAVPLLTGSGTRGKIVEALAYERVVVTTTKGVEGLELQEGEGVLIADEPEVFARRLNNVLAAPGTRAEIARRGRQAVIARYDWSVVAAGLKAGWEDCLSRPPGPGSEGPRRPIRVARGEIA